MISRAALLLAAGLMAASLACARADLPATSTVLTSTRQVTSLLALADGTLWVGTSGGILRRGSDGTWRKWTRRDGLPAHEVRALALGTDGTVTATLPRATVAWRDGAWVAAPAAPDAPREADETCRTEWRGQTVTATLSVLHIGQQRLALPPSRGTHVSALLARGDALWAALFGEGLWIWDGKAWKAAELGLPPPAREITALAAQGDTLWIGTRRAGVWRRDGAGWTQHLQPDEPFDHNVQALALADGAVLVSTLEDGLATLAPGGWRHETAAVLSSDAPRQSVAFDGALYLRHGGGRVDRRDGSGVWTRGVFSALPRKQVSALAADDKRLYAAQWGGWSEWDGRQWTHRLSLPELQGLPITALLPDGPTLWVGTQGRGLAEIERATGRGRRSPRFVRWHDERHGLPDDWITVLARVNDTLYAGTFVGGLARWDGTKWTSALAGQNVTALEPDGAGGIFVATRAGVWHEQPDGTRKPIAPPFLDTEAQALLRTPDGGGLWVGTRTGLFYVRVARSAMNESKVDGHGAALAVTRFGFRLLGEMEEKARGDNVFVSPAGIAFALGMTMQGAGGETKTAMARTLQLGGSSVEEAAHGSAALLRALRQPDPKVQLAIASALWADKRLAFAPEFLDASRRLYDATAATLDFGNPAAALAAINGWVRENTRGKIESLLTAPDIAGATSAVLTNAVFFKGLWTQPFDRAQTREGDFTPAGGARIKLPMMTRTGQFGYLTGERFAAVRLPYGESGKIALYVFLPDPASRLDAFLRTLSAEAWEAWMPRFRPTRVEIVLPRFQIESETALNEPLAALGMGIAFRPGADFRPMGLSGGDYISKVKHKAGMEVNEEGTVAAAATAVIMTRSLPIAPPRFVVNRPFFCALRDDATGTLLFLGAISKPK